jgi:hypothetical protein
LRAGSSQPEHRLHREKLIGTNFAKPDASQKIESDAKNIRFSDSIARIRPAFKPFSITNLLQPTKKSDFFSQHIGTSEAERQQLAQTALDEIIFGFCHDDV